MINKTRHTPLLALLTLLVAPACGGGEGGTQSKALNVSWTFPSGDCASNAVETVRVSWGLQGAMPAEVRFPCSAGGGKLGDVMEGSGTYSVVAQGLDAGGVARVETFGQSISAQAVVLGGASVGLTLRPKAANVVVTWSLGADGCPPRVILPYFIALYEAPAMTGGALTMKVKEKQESCTSRMVTLDQIAPGSYVVELDSRAVTPAVRSTKPVTVTAGQDAAVSFTL